MIQTNRLTERLEIFEVVPSASTIGAVTETLSPFATIYGTLLQQKGDTSYTKLPGAVYTDAISFYCRFLALSEKKKFKLTYQDKYYNIIEVNNVGNRSREATIIRCSNVR